MRMDGIGDMVLFQGAFRYYPAAFGAAHSEITVLGQAYWASLAEVVYQGCRFRAIDEHAFARRPSTASRHRCGCAGSGLRWLSAILYFRQPLVADALVYASGAPLRIVAQPYISPKTRRCSTGIWRGFTG